jgi:hypothetical protein
MTAQARVPPGRSWVELSGIQQASICAVEPRWPDGSAGPVSTTATLVRALDVTVLQPGIWRDGRASWESSGNRLLFFPDVPDGHPIQPRLSEDAGATWLTSPGLPFPLTWTSLRTCSQGDRLWLARTRKGATGLEILLAMSPDAGRSWEPPRVLAAGLASGLLALLPDGPDLDLFVWQGERTVHARVAAGVDGPLLFEPVGDFPRESWAGAARTGDGTIHVLGRCSALPRRLLYTRLLRGQRNWQPAAPYPGGAADGEAPVLTVSGQRLYAVWLNPAARREEPVLVFGRSLDAGRTWSAPRPLTQTAFLPDSTQEGMLRYSLVADGEVVGLAFQDDVGFISSRVRLLRSLDGGDAFTELASARVSAGKVMGASLRALPDATVYGLFLASLEVHGLVRFPPLLPAGKPSAGLGPSTRIH